jgi:hypothetical protein
MKIKVTVSTRKVGSQCERTFEIEDDLTDDEIEQIAQEAMWNMVEWNWKKEKYGTTV